MGWVLKSSFIICEGWGGGDSGSHKGRDLFYGGELTPLGTMVALILQSFL